MFLRLAQAASVVQSGGWGQGPTQKKLYSGSRRLLWEQWLLRRPSHRETPTTQESLWTRKSLSCWHLYVLHTAVDLFAPGSFKRSQAGSFQIRKISCSRWIDWEGNCCERLAIYSQQQHEGKDVVHSAEPFQTATVAREVNECVQEQEGKVLFHLSSYLKLLICTHYTRCIPHPPPKKPESLKTDFHSSITELVHILNIINKVIN